MDRMVYLAMSGARQTMLAMAANTNNLANVSTTGFKADLAAFRSQPVYGPGQPSRVYAMAERTGTDLSDGDVMRTGNELDIAINGDGWIAVQAPDGSEAYTRAGDLRVSSLGLLENGAGHRVLGNGGPVAVPPSESLVIGTDGTISIRPVGQAANTLAAVDRIKLVRPDLADLEKHADGLMHLKKGVEAPAADASVTLIHGAIESSNVSAVESLVNMITLQRNFEMQIKMMRKAEENDQASAQMMRIS